MLGTEQPVHGGWRGKDLECVIRVWIVQNFGRIALWEKAEEALVKVSLMLGRRFEAGEFIVRGKEVARGEISVYMSLFV